ncbi:MAG: hypothetical protein M1491_01825 [Deltaproteobacteria bacterium]|nr:hypothetical protein [Deltaproteobacteria bacterium]MCL5277574.1 hypothetical protein [Deltaproteobacteria bacterium]
MTILFLIIYNIAIGVGILLLVPLLLVLRPKHLIHVQERMGVLPCIKGCVWVHAASVGEVKASVPLLKVIVSSGRNALLTTMTPAGRQYASTLNMKGVSVSYAPADSIVFTLYAMHRVRPSVLIILETEIWPDLIVSASLSKTDIVSINARLSEKAFRGYLYMRPVMSYLLKRFKMLCVQTQEDADRFVRLGAQKKDIHITGNIKYAADNTSTTPIAKEIQGLFKGRPVIIAGSTHAGEEQIVINCFLSLKGHVKAPLLILAPRHINRLGEVEDMLDCTGLNFIQRSMITSATSPDNYEVIILDTVGELADIYSIGDAIFIGGSMVPVGGHNLIEAVLHKKPVIYGRYTDSIKESVSILNGNGGIMVNNEEELCGAIDDLVEHPDKAERLGEKAFATIAQKVGTLNNVTDILRKAGVL